MLDWWRLFDFISHNIVNASVVHFSWYLIFYVFVCYTLRVLRCVNVILTFFRCYIIFLDVVVVAAAAFFGIGNVFSLISLTCSLFFSPSSLRRRHRHRTCTWVGRVVLIFCFSRLFWFLVCCWVFLWILFHLLSVPSKIDFVSFLVSIEQKPVCVVSFFSIFIWYKHTHTHRHISVVWSLDHLSASRSNYFIFLPPAPLFLNACRCSYVGFLFRSTLKSLDSKSFIIELLVWR